MKAYSLSSIAKSSNSSTERNGVSEGSGTVGSGGGGARTGGGGGGFMSPDTLRGTADTGRGGAP